MRSNFDDYSGVERVFMNSMPKKAENLFDDNGARVERAMGFLWKHFSGWPGQTCFVYDQMRAIICAVLLSVHEAKNGDGDDIDKRIQRHDRLQTLGQVSSLEDVTCEVCGFSPVAFVMMEDTILSGFIRNQRPDIDPKMSSCGWTGAYDYKGLTNLIFKERCETIVEMADRYMRNTPQKWIDAVNEQYKIHDVYKAIQFIALVDDAAGYEYYSVSEECDKIMILILAAMNVNLMFEINRARQIGGEIAASRVCGKEDFFLDTWRHHTLYAPGISMTDEELGDILCRFI